MDSSKQKPEPLLADWMRDEVREIVREELEAYFDYHRQVAESQDDPTIILQPSGDSKAILQAVLQRVPKVGSEDT